VSLSWTKPRVVASEYLTNGDWIAQHFSTLSFPRNDWKAMAAARFAVRGKYDPEEYNFKLLTVRGAFFIRAASLFFTSFG